MILLLLDAFYSGPFDLEMTNDDAKEHRCNENCVKWHAHNQEESGETWSHCIHLWHYREVTQVDLQDRVERYRQVSKVFDLTTKDDISTDWICQCEDEQNYEDVHDIFATLA